MGWLPLESTPEVLTPYARKLGLPAPWGFADVWGLDEDLLAMVPQPCAAVCLLFPCRDGLARGRRAELREKRRAAGSDSAPEREVFFVRQGDELGNACGTLALIHAVANAAHYGALALTPDSPLAKFKEETAALSPEDRGAALADHALIRQLSDETAAAGQTAGAGTDDAQDQHFIAFVRGADGGAYELDGRTLDQQGRAMAVRHGHADAGLPFLRLVAKVIQADFMARDPDSVNFNVTALVHQPEGA